MNNQIVCIKCLSNMTKIFDKYICNNCCNIQTIINNQLFTYNLKKEEFECYEKENKECKKN